MSKFDIIVESVITEALDINLNKFFEKATADIKDVTYERVKDFTGDKRVFNIYHKDKVIAHVIKKKHFIKPKFIMKPEDKNLKIKPIILPYDKGFKIKYSRLGNVVTDFTNFVEKCKGC